MDRVKFTGRRDTSRSSSMSLLPVPLEELCSVISKRSSVSPITDSENVNSSKPLFRSSVNESSVGGVLSAV